MNLLLFSDFHSGIDLAALKSVIAAVPTPDVVFTMGDISVRELQAIKSFISASPIFGICGNHDSHSALSITNIPDIHGKRIEIGGISFAGFEGSVRYKDGPYVMYSQKESIEIARSLPESDVLISHDRAFTGSKLKLFGMYSKNLHGGLIGISDYLRHHSPMLHIHGHIHRNEQYRYNGINTISVFGAVFVSIRDGALKEYRVLLEP